MSDYISREAAYETLSEYYHLRTEIQHFSLRDALELVPAADVAPVRRGKLVTDEYGNFACSECRKEPFYDDLGFGYICSDFCPNCGADMREVSTSEESLNSGGHEKEQEYNG